MPGIVHATVEKLVQVLGLPTALRFAEVFGGVRVYVPHPTRIEASHPIAKAIGVEAARQLATEWQQLEIAVPRCAALLRRQRDRALRADRAALSARQAALKYEVNERTVFRIWARGEGQEDEPGDAAASTQRSLF